jgi:hypothetical protein
MTQESLALLNVLFSEPSSRYSILALIIRVLSSRGALPPIVALSRSPFLKSLTDSILAEHSPHLFHREIAALVLASPYFAVYAPDSLVEMLPDLLAILGRTLSRRTDLRVGSDTEEDNRSPEAERSTSTSGDMRPDPRNPDSSQPRERFRARSRGTLPLGNGSGLSLLFTSWLFNVSSHPKIQQHVCPPPMGRLMHHSSLRSYMGYFRAILLPSYEGVKACVLSPSLH